MQNKRVINVGLIISIFIALSMIMPVGTIFAENSASDTVQEVSSTSVPMASTIYVNGYEFDCLAEEPNIPENLKAGYNEPGQETKYLVHMVGPVMQEWHDGITGLGGEIITYVHNFAYLVKMTPEEARQIESEPYVDWIGDYHPAYKISPDIDDVFISLEIENSKSAYSVLPQIRTYFFSVQENQISDGIILKGQAFNLEAVDKLAWFNEVDYISPWVPEQLMGEMSSQIIGGGLWAMDDDANHDTPYRAYGDHGAYVNQIGWTGSGVTIGVADTGLGDGTTPGAGHVDFQSRVLGGTWYGTSTDWADGHGHGTHCAGLATANTYAGSGLTYAGYGPYYLAQGLSYDANLYAVKIFTDAGGWEGPADYKDILYDSYTGGARVSTNSWGANSGGAYGASDSAYDQAVRDADTGTGGNQQLITFVAAGNAGSGTNTVGSPGNAKNVITIGGVENYAPDASSYGNTYSTTADNPDVMYTSSSRGWTDDGRIKPDVLTPAVNTLSTHSPVAGDNLFGLYTADNRYEWCTGTSQATPNAAGGGGVIYEWYQATYGVPPTPSMVKALMVNSAIDIGTADIPNQDEGWGRVFLPTIFDGSAPWIIKDTEPELTTGVTHEFTASYSDPSLPLKITMAYTDTYAASGATVTLQNQVNLEVVTPLGTVYHGNAFSGGYSITGTPIATFDTNGDGYDDRNNVENVYIPPGSLEAGQYTIRIIGTNVPTDADFDGALDQDYSLVIYNAMDVSSQGTIDLDRSLYAGEDTAVITVGDTDLNTDINVQTVDVTIDSTTEAAGETVTLTETGGDTSMFQGTITISLTDSNGVLQVSHGDTITATYNDADDGTGSPATVTATATVDAQVASATGLTVEWTGVATQDLINDNVEGGDIGWTDSANWAIRTVTANSPTNSWNCGDLDYGDSWSETLVSPSFDLPAAATSATWSWYHDYDFEANWDGGVVEINTGSGWTRVTPVGGYDNTLGTGYSNVLEGQAAFTGDSAGFVYDEVNLTPFIGNTCQVRYWMGTDSFNTADDGWNVDDIVIHIVGGGGTTDDNAVNWTASTDDGAGANDVDYYQIYRTTSSTGPWDATTEYTTKTATGALSYSYIDSGAGEFDGTVWWYVVRAVDAAGNVDPNINAVPEPSAGNNPPNAPFNPVPADMATGISTSPTLSVNVTDPDGDPMSVTFYDAAGPTQIGTTQTGIASGGTASVIWSGLAESTTYSWYATAFDGEFTTTSVTWSFTTLDTVAPASPLGLTVEHTGTTSTTDVASGRTLTAGSEVGTYVDTQTQDNVYHQLTGTITGGPAANPQYGIDVAYSILLDAAGSAPYSVYLDAYHNGDENFNVNYQVNGGGYTTLGQLTRTSDTNTYDSYGITANPGDTVDIQFIDTVRTNGEGLEVLYVDHVYIESASGGGGTDDNAVNWTASTDDGAGANDVDYYQLYRSNVETGPWDATTEYAQVTATGAASYSYIDAGAGEFDGTIWWYVVRAVDLSLNMDSNINAVPEPSITTTAYDIPIPALGWVFVSFPIDISGNVQTILDDSVNGDGGTTWDMAKWYDGQTKVWKSYRAGYASTLTIIDNHMGVWLHVTANGGDQNLTTAQAGNLPASETITLYAGWNLVGCPLGTNTTASVTLPIEADIIGIWKATSPYVTETTDLTSVTMEQGNAYWVHVTADTTWNV